MNIPNFPPKLQGHQFNPFQQFSHPQTTSREHPFGVQNLSYKK
jgi:hypothetical protein